MNDFIKKEIVKEREGANISPINVDTQSRYLINPTNAPGVSVGTVHHMPTHKAIWLDELGKVVIDAQNLKEQNERNLLDIQLKKMDLKFREDWQGIHDKYSDKYHDYLSAYNNLWAEKKKLILDNKYLMNDEKQEYLQKKDLEQYKGRLDIQETRDKYYIQEQTDNSLSAIDEYVKIAETYDSKDDKKAEEVYKSIADTANGLKKLTGMADESYIVLLGKKIGGAESNRLLNEMSKIQADNIPLAQKKAKLDNLYNLFSTKGIAETQATEIVDKYYKGDNRERAIEYMTAQMQGNNRQVINRARIEFGRLEREERARTKLQHVARQQQEYLRERQIEDAWNKKDALTLSELYDGRTSKNRLSMQEFLSDPKYMESVTDKHWDTFGDSQNGETLKILTPSALQGLRNQMINIKNNGGSLADQYQPLFAYATELSNGDEGKRNNILKDYGLSTGMDPAIIIKGEKNPDYFKLAQTVNDGVGYINNIGIDEGQKRKILDNKDFKEIASKFAENGVVGEATALKYLTGIALKTNNFRELTQDYYYIIKDTAKQLNNKNKNDYDALQNDIKIVSEFTSKRTNYRYTNLKNRNMKEIKPVEYKSEFLDEQNEVFGG
ncbi:hypothetical protein IX317_000350 [Fusobacterium sp. DD29]|uniref:hypothetical protein n=1 Tax=unclassified Fusobacterium TaxID=2648384 RepID=UPI001B8BEC89|nr:MULTISPECIES: hypothetical protein [unclassified Fusobacterium]MBR8748691.1 hypothetical protein [Fusobacterium sp. DD29]MBR8760957.1 hypothetical protein [Fusobacterium sp. DD25]MBR8766970.1 hypothetical protein [Fusobacterium sp. DD43]MBR8770971.1 hypothetical protein [Fusobacterium sp. DD40]MBR8775246.1 hypothetical protein [Fusobacterium sp. DD17]